MSSPPSWFGDSRYAALTLSGDRECLRTWLAWLECARDWGSDLDDATWAYRAATLGEELPGDEPPHFGQPVIGFPPTRVVEIDARYPSLGAVGRIEVNLSAPDEVLAELVVEAARSMRQALAAQLPAAAPTLAARRGRRPRKRALAPRISPQRLSDWKTNRICELAELKWWAARQPKRPAKAQLGLWLFGEVDQPSKRFARSNKMLQTAIGLLPVLWLECFGDPSGATGISELAIRLPAVSPKQRSLTA
jgi:hypothetical protein